jgi:segregation and condensation protein A
MAVLAGAAAAVEIAGGPRPEVAARVQLETWEGPLGLLLALIESRELDVLRVPLGALAEAYLDALAGLEGDRLPHISAFVSVASQLILIKSRALLPRAPAATAPTDEVADPEAALRARLLLYKAYRDAGSLLLATAIERVGLFRREPAAAGASARAGAVPADEPPLDPAVLVRALDGVVRIALPPERPPEIVPRTITLTERARIIRAAVGDAGTVVLQELLHGVRDRVVVAVTFLAMLELMKRREIVVEQREPWGPILARATTADERAAAGLAASTDDEPLDESLGSFA